MTCAPPTRGPSPRTPQTPPPTPIRKPPPASSFLDLSFRRPAAPLEGGAQFRRDRAHGGQGPLLGAPPLLGSHLLRLLSLLALLRQHLLGLRCPRCDGTHRSRAGGGTPAGARALK